MFLSIRLYVCRIAFNVIEQTYRRKDVQTYRRIDVQTYKKMCNLLLSFRLDYHFFQNCQVRIIQCTAKRSIECSYSSIWGRYTQRISDWNAASFMFKYIDEKKIVSLNLFTICSYLDFFIYNFNAFSFQNNQPGRFEFIRNTRIVR